MNCSVADLPGDPDERAGALEVAAKADGFPADLIVHDDDPHVLARQAGGGGVDGGIADRVAGGGFVHVARGGFERHRARVGHGLHGSDETASHGIAVTIVSTAAARGARLRPSDERPCHRRRPIAAVQRPECRQGR